MFPDDHPIQIQFWERLRHRNTADVLIVRTILWTVLYSWAYLQGPQQSCIGTRSSLSCTRMWVTTSASALAFGLESSRTKSWVPIRYLAGWLLSDIGLFRNLFCRDCLKMFLVTGQSLWFQHEGSHLWGCPVMVERDILVTMKVHWTSRANCIDSIVAGSDPVGCFPAVDTWSRTFYAVPRTTIENIVAKLQVVVTTSDANTLRRVRQNVVWCTSV
jgi:hypothetical protein